MPPPDTCAFCNSADSDEITGRLQRTPDGSVVAHYYCMLYSPKVISIDSQEPIEGFDFDIPSVQREIDRGYYLRCNLCRKSGATVGCDVTSCRRTYHYPCLKKAKGSPSKYGYVVYCAWHKKKKPGNVSKDSDGKTKNQRGRNRKSLAKTSRKSRRNIEKRRCDNADVQNVQMTEESEESFSLPIHSVIELEEKEEAVPSTSGQYMTLSTSSEESDSILSPKVNSVFSLSGLPKSKRRRLLRKPNEKNKMTTEDALHRVGSDMSTCSANSEMDKTPERLLDITAPVSPSGCSTTEKAFTEEQPVSSQDSLSKRERNTLNNVISRLPIKGSLSEKLKGIAPQIKSNIESPKRNTNKDAEQSRDGQVTSEGSPSSIAEYETAGNELQEPVENPVHPMKEAALVCQERSKSTTRKRELFQEQLPNMRLQQTEGNLTKLLAFPEEQDDRSFREESLLEEVATPGSAVSELASEHQSGPSRISISLKRRLFDSRHRRKNRSGFQYERVGDLDDIDGFGRAVAGQCRLIPHDRQAKYMSYVLASADLFCGPTTLPGLDVLITNLSTVLESSQPSTPCSACGSSG